MNTSIFSTEDIQKRKDALLLKGNSKYINLLGFLRDLYTKVVDANKASEDESVQALLTKLRGQISAFEAAYDLGMQLLKIDEHARFTNALLDRVYDTVGSGAELLVGYDPSILFMEREDEKTGKVKHIDLLASMFGAKSLDSTLLLEVVDEDMLRQIFKLMIELYRHACLMVVQVRERSVRILFKILARNKTDLSGGMGGVMNSVVKKENMDDLKTLMETLSVDGSMERVVTIFQRVLLVTTVDRKPDRTKSSVAMKGLLAELDLVVEDDDLVPILESIEGGDDEKLTELVGADMVQKVLQGYRDKNIIKYDPMNMIKNICPTLMNAMQSQDENAMAKVMADLSRTTNVDPNTMNVLKEMEDKIKAEQEEATEATKEPQMGE